VRPTSETVIWNMFGKWISSYRDLPLKINQWANVVRWEMRTRPFIRSSEFLWQEGHTAHATSADAVQTAVEMLDIYESVCKDMLALPVIKGRKSPSERFAGADDTYTIEALMQNGWALQSGTSHFLGQNFAKAFDVFFQPITGARELVWATSWGVSTRLIGALIMTHSDDKGLVLPPRVAPIQIVIVPIVKGPGEETNKVNARIDEIVQQLKKKGIRVKVDDRDNMRPGAKYFEWERKGLPLRLDIGPRDVNANTAVLATRYNSQKTTIPVDISTIADTIQEQLDSIHENLFTQAKQRLESKIFRVSKYEEMKTMIESASNGDAGQAGFYLAPWKCDAKNEELIKGETKATIRCYPFSMNEKAVPGSGIGPDVKCFYSGEQATHYALFARAF
jgi:prolyl-tRNA synthetase